MKLVTTERRKNYLVSESNYRTTKFFTENLLAGNNEEISNINELTCLFWFINFKYW